MRKTRKALLTCHAAAFVLLGFFLFVTGDVGENASATADEPIYIRSGLLILDSMDFTINEISSPFLFKMINALPVAGLPGAHGVAKHADRTEENRDWSPLIKQWLAGTRTLKILGPRIALPAARLVSRLCGLLLGLAIYLVSLRIMGKWGALLALFLFVLLPECCAHFSLATLDAGLALTTFLTLIAFGAFFKKPNPLTAGVTGLLLGTVLLTKTTGVVLSGYLVLACLFKKKERLKIVPGLLVIALCAWVTLNSAFFFEGTFDTLSDRPEYPKIQQRIQGITGAQWAAEHLPLLLPRSFMNTLMTQAAIMGKGKRIFFHGEHTTQGWWWLMGISLLIKTPIPFLLLAIAGAWMVRRKPMLWLYLGFFLFMLLFFSMLSKSNCGVRYLLPAWPCLAMASAWGLAHLLKRSWGFKCLGLGLMGWLLVSNLFIHPHHLSFANEGVGGASNLYKWLGDSNLDWGQDLPALNETLKKHDLGAPFLSFFGSDDPRAYGIKYKALPSVGLPPEPGQKWWFEKGSVERFDLKPGVYAISANNLQGTFLKDPDLYAAFRERTPDFRAGYSILIYDLREP